MYLINFLFVKKSGNPFIIVSKMEPDAQYTLPPLLKIGMYTTNTFMCPRRNLIGHILSFALRS